ncbi:PA0069 family radical SAM protein [Salinarimonas ramus]|uniref:Radical SAM protein n=1 Tax=Salinarimonas ramus TaxID=690164 RepID=A0A917Q5V2_9HYPH|nr:PA0069 family radical SAM protein [Salinarimonas ramus]GGK26243.1 radical SAM protein [Salinarimonas ramus]
MSPIANAERAARHVVIPGPRESAPRELSARDLQRRALLRDAGRPDAVAERLRRGRGAQTNETGRFERITREAFEEDRLHDEEERALALATEVIEERPRTIIAKNQSPDIGFDYSINPYRGCEHGCFYCYARPSHAYHGLSAGLDFETKLFAKPDAAALLERELAARSYEAKPIALGANTDPYQPVERRYRITRSVLEVLAKRAHPVGIVTKSHLVTRDVDILGPMAERGLAKVAISLTTLDPVLARRMEPRAATPARRLDAIKRLTDEGIPVTVLVAPIVPAINDHEIERILEAAHAAGAREAGYVLLRLPNELKDLARDWLVEHYPDRLERVLSLVRQTRGGKEYDATWGVRQTGTGPYAWMIGRRFENAARRLGLNQRRTRLRTDLFEPPAIARKRAAENQLSLFG